MQHRDPHNRRVFFRFAGAAASAAAVCATAPVCRAAADPSRNPPMKKVPFSLGLASYTLRKFNLDETLAMTKRVGLTHICLKSFHLPLDATSEQIAAAVEKVKAAGLDLYGGGVITMRKEEEVDQAFEYAKAACMRTIVGAPVPDVLPLVDQKVKQYDIAVAIHNHGPGDKIYPTPESIYEKIENLDPRIGLCMDIGLHAVKVARHLEDNYVLDEMHSRLLSQELHDALVKKGFLKDL